MIPGYLSSLFYENKTLQANAIAETITERDTASDEPANKNYDEFSLSLSLSLSL